MKFKKLTNFNIAMGWFHAVQAIIILLISSESTRDVTASYLKYDETTAALVPATRVLFSVELGALVALFFALSAAAHWYVGTIGNKWYIKNLKKGINKARWYEYSASASVMIVLIAMLSGIFDAGTLLALFVITAVMNLMGLVMEVHNQTTSKTSWLSYNIGVLAGITPWLVIGLSLWAGETASTVEQIPTFVYGIYISLFLFFNSFAINMILQYKKIGKWQEYLYGERAYIILSLVAKSLLAWQVYAGTLQPA